MARGEIDVVTARNPNIVVHEPKTKLDGFSKYIQDHKFQFDNTFQESDTSEDVFKYSIK